MLGVLPFVEDPDLSWSAAPALPQHLPPCHIIVHPFDVHGRHVFFVRKGTKCLIYEYFAEVSLYECPCVHQKVINQPWILLMEAFSNRPCSELDAGVVWKVGSHQNKRTSLNDLIKHVLQPVHCSDYEEVKIFVVVAERIIFCSFS